jgi:hypothetical protein
VRRQPKSARTDGKQALCMTVRGRDLRQRGMQRGWESLY